MKTVITAVSSMPAIKPKTGFENFISRLVNSGTSFRGSTAPLIASIPNIKTENPRKIDPMFFFVAFAE